jgi:hypothetical protein
MHVWMNRWMQIDVGIAIAYVHRQWVDAAYQAFYNRLLLNFQVQSHLCVLAQGLHDYLLLRPPPLQ